MKLFKKISVSDKGTQIGSRKFAQSEAFTSTDLEDVQDYIKLNPLPLFTNKNLVYTDLDFIGTMIGDGNGNVVKDNNSDSPKLMLALSQLTTQSGENIFSLETGKNPSIRLSRPYNLLNSKFATQGEEADEKARLEAENKAKEEADEKARLEAENKAKEEAENKAKEEADEKARLEAENKAKEEAENKAKEEADEKARLEAENKAKEEADEKARLEAEKKATTAKKATTTTTKK